MNTINVAISCVDSAGANWIPVKEEFINSATIQSHYANRKLFGNDKELLLIEQVKTPDNKACIYYQYLLYGICDASDREESFFGLTVVTDTLCADANLMFDLCRKALNKYVIGKILQPKGGTYKVSAILSTQESVRKEIDNFFAKVLVTYQDFGILEDVPVAPSSSSHQPVSLNNEKQVLCRLNPNDAAPAKITEHIKAGKKVAVSNCYPSLAQQRMVEEAKRVENELASCKTQLADTKSSLAEVKKQATDAIQKKQQLQGEINDIRAENNRDSQKLQAEIDRLKREHEAEISKYKGQGNYPVQKQLDEINAKLNQVLSQNRTAQPPKLQKGQMWKTKKGKREQQEHANPDFPVSDRNKRFYIIGLAFVLVIIIIVLLSVSMCSGDEKDKKEEKEKREYYYNHDDTTSSQAKPLIFNTSIPKDSQPLTESEPADEEIPLNPNTPPDHE